jgi:hypothetical protein
MTNDYPYASIKETSLLGRYVNYQKIKPVIDKIGVSHNVETLGHSVLEIPIHGITLGKGKTKILMWSQMHGNESTTTKAVFDLIQALVQSGGTSEALLNKCTIKIIPMLNPDGARAYTRVNANNIDLNRDAQDLSQPESQILRKTYLDFKPDFCFNLHDQRSIFSAGHRPFPATLSFLAPAADKDRHISKSRAISMKLIAAVNHFIQTLIPDQVGRYDDVFNRNCVGDTFQMLNTPTVLFEAGHFQEDYDREQTRKFLFLALWEALKVITLDNLDAKTEEDYFSIPENQKCYFDVIIKNAHKISASFEQGASIGILFKEVLVGDRVEFIPHIEKSGALNTYFGHRIFDCEQPKDLGLLKKQQELIALLN